MLIRPGDFVECLETSETEEGVSVWAREIYCVHEIDPLISQECECWHGPECQSPGVKLIDPILPDPQWWCGTIFRLVYRPKFRWEALFKAPLLIQNGKPHETS